MNNIHVMNVDGGIHEIPLPFDNVNGRLWLCGKHFIAPNPDRVREQTDGATVVCLVHREELAHRYDNYIEWLIEHRNDHAVWYPIHDMNTPSIDEAMEFYADLAQRVSDGTNLVVHCAAGIGRAGSTAIGILMSLGMTLQDAQPHVRKHRPGAGPQTDVQQYLLDEVAEKNGFR
jgi:protein-tyrosine phosphatase